MKKYIAFALCALMLIPGCGTMSNTAKDSLIGAGGGAALGAVIGGLIGKDAKGAAIGAAIGTAVGGSAGAIIGNKMDKKAAELAGLLPTTLNSWIKMKAYPREKNLQKLADVFHVNIVDLTGDVEAADERRKYLTIGASDMLAAYNGDREFRQWCDLGLKLRRRKRMHAYIQNLEKMLEEEDATG